MFSKQRQHYNAVRGTSVHVMINQTMQNNVELAHFMSVVPLLFSHPAYSQAYIGQEFQPVYNRAMYTPPPIPPAPPHRGYFCQRRPLFTNCFQNSVYAGYDSYVQPLVAGNRFVRLAEENSRPAFQSFHNLVGTFNSIAVTLDSSYHALHGLFCAMVSVVDNFSQLGARACHVLSSTTMFQLLQRLLTSWLQFLRHRTMRDVGVVLHPSVLPGGDAEASGAARWRRSVFICVFFAVAFGGPWLIRRLLLKISGVKGIT